MSDRQWRTARRAVGGFLAAASAIAVVSLAIVPSPGAQPGDEADLSVSKSDNPDPVVVGATLAYTLAVRNLGPDPATGVRLTDKLPNRLEGAAVSSASGTCAIRGRTVVCDLGRIGVGTGATVATVAITARPTRPGRITNTATVRSKVRDPRAGNDLVSESTRVLPLRTARCAGFPATVVGTRAGERLVGTRGNDVVVARGGADVIRTFRGHDFVCAGGGNDVVKSGVWADSVFGNAGRDRLIGGGGRDRLRGNRGRDRLLGRAGSDRLAGGRGFDVCRGNRGRDVERGCER